MQPEWQNREDLLGGLGDDDDADALNDETFGDGGWDDPAPMGDISDLSAMTLGKADILQEAAQRVPGAQHATDGADFAFPSLPMGASLLGGPAKPATPAGLMTPQMMMQSVADSQDKASFFSSAAQDLPVTGAQRHSAVGGASTIGAPSSDWSVPTPQSVGVGGVGMGPFAGGVGAVQAGNHQSQQHGLHMPQQQQQPQPQQQQPTYQMHAPPPQNGGGKVMSLADIEAQMMSSQQQPQQPPPPQQQQQQQHQHPQRQQLPPHIQQQMMAQQHAMFMRQQQMLMQQQQQHPHPHQQMPPQVQMLQQQQQMLQQLQQQRQHPQQPHNQAPGGGGILPPPARSLDEIIHEEELASGGQARRMPLPAPTATPAASLFAAGGNLHTRQWQRMTMDEVNFIIKMHQGMLRDAAATDVYYTMLLAKQGWRANFSGPQIGGRLVTKHKACVLA